MITVQRLKHGTVYWARCDSCRRETHEGSPNATLRMFWFQCLAADWELPPPFPCATHADLSNLKAYCPRCVEKGLLPAGYRARLTTPTIHPHKDFEP